MSVEHLPVSGALLDYVRSVSSPEPAVLTRLREETARDPAGLMQISREVGVLLGQVARMLRARRCIEVGVFTGYSSICVASALPEDGRLICCDVSEEWTAIARRYWEEAGVEAKIELRLAPALETLDTLIDGDAGGTFDFAFIDADKTNYRHYYERLLRLVRPGGVIAIDNVLWYGRVIDAADNDADTVAIREFNALLRNDPRVEPCLLPIGDGLTLAFVK